MAVRVDAAAGVVTDDDRTWSLDLDCRTGGATVVVDGVAHHVAPLRWREKQRLARWSQLGAGFVARQLVQLALPETSEPPAEEATEVVAAVAAWVNGETLGLPLESGLLTHVTLDVCRETGLAPADLDDRDALEVEAMWSALQQSGAAVSRSAASQAATPWTGSLEAGEWSDATRIVIVPDAPEDGEDRDDPSIAVAAAEGPRPVDPPPGAPLGPQPVEPQPHSPPDPPVAGPSPAHATPAAVVPSPAHAAPAAVAASAATPRRRRPMPRFRVLPSAGLVSTTTDLPDRLATLDRSIAAPSPRLSDEVFASDPTTVSSRARVRTGPNVVEQRPRHATSEPVREQDSRSIQPVPDTQVDVDELAETVLEVLADEVEQAAEALGIEV